MARLRNKSGNHTVVYSGSVADVRNTTRWRTLQHVHQACRQVIALGHTLDDRDMIGYITYMIGNYGKLVTGAGHPSGVAKFGII